MRFTLSLTLAAATLAAPAMARDRPTAEDLRSGRCTIQQVHTPAGKLVHAAPIARCSDDAATIAWRDRAVEQPEIAAVESKPR